MNTSLDLNRLMFDPTSADGYGGFDSTTVGSFVIDGYGNQISSTIVSPTNTSLDVFAALADGYGNPISSSLGSLNVNLTNTSGTAYDTNYGAVGTATLRTAAQIGNATGAADFNNGATGAQTLRVTSNLSDGYGNQVTSTGGSLDVNITNDIATYAEDSPHNSGDMGSFMLGVRNDNDAVLTDNNLDYSAFAVDAYGRIKTVANIIVEPSNAEFIEESAHLFSDVLLHVGTVVKMDALALPNSDNTYSSFFVDGYGNLKVVLDSVADNTPDKYNPIKVGSRAVTGPLAALSAYDNRADLISDLYRRIYINDSANIGLKSTAFTVSTSQSSLVAVASSLGGRRKMIVQNRSTKSIFVGETGVTTLTGLEIRGGVSMSLDIGPDVGLFAIAATAGNDIRVFELA